MRVLSYPRNPQFEAAPRPAPYTGFQCYCESGIGGLLHPVRAPSSSCVRIPVQNAHRVAATVLRYDTQTYMVSGETVRDQNRWIVLPRR